MADKACTRCGGKGEIKMFAHVSWGVCFRCWGAGVEMPPAEREKARIFFRKMMGCR